MKNKLLITTLIICVFPVAAFSQQQSLYSQYTLNKYLYNPAIAGADGYTSVNLLARKQLIGFENSPGTYVFSGQTRLLPESYIVKMMQVKKKESKKTRSGRIGLGGSVFTDQNGAIGKTGFQFTYAYHLNFNNKAQLSFGLSASGYQFHLREVKAIKDNTDPLLDGNSKTFFIPDANFGTYLLTDHFYGGFSTSNLFGAYLKLGKNALDEYRIPRYYYLVGGYKWYPTEDLKVEPSFIMQTRKGSPEVDFNTTVTYRSELWGGLSYRTDKTMVIMAGFSMQGLVIGYAYDISFNTVSNYTHGSHEIIAGFKFGDNSASRTRWLRKDTKTFEN
jgi:type IX secretion system PorP/SprF family membrane protein